MIQAAGSQLLSPGGDSSYMRYSQPLRCWSTPQRRATRTRRATAAKIEPSTIVCDQLERRRTSPGIVRRIESQTEGSMLASKPLGFGPTVKVPVGRTPFGSVHAFRRDQVGAG